MNVLCVHHEDALDDPRWNNGYDLVLDSGWGGPNAYARLEKRLQARVLSIYGFADARQTPRKVNASLDILRGRVIDSRGVDQIELVSPAMRQSLFLAHWVDAAVREAEGASRIDATRPHPFADALARRLGLAANSITPGPSVGPWSRARTHMRTILDLSPPERVELALNKLDPDYRARRRTTSRVPLPHGCILAPSAYRNATRAIERVATLLPRRKFALVPLQENARPREPPPNIVVVDPAPYVPAPASRREEEQRLAEAVSRVREDTCLRTDALCTAVDLGLFDAFPRAFRRGLSVRDAAWQMLTTGDVAAVLSADENNPDTRSFILVANSNGIPTATMHHGALDANMLVKQLSADIYVVQGRMERDYLLQECGLPASRIAMGSERADNVIVRKLSGNDVFFFSEPYEVGSGRALEHYRDVLPPLAELAAGRGGRLVVKLHPFESALARRRLVEDVLSPLERSRVDISTEATTPALLRQAAFAVTATSSAAVDCAREGIPTFLCAWLEPPIYNYDEVYERAGVGKALHHPSELAAIPDLLRTEELPRRHFASQVDSPFDAPSWDRLLGGAQ